MTTCSPKTLPRPKRQFAPKISKKSKAVVKRGRKPAKPHQLDLLLDFTRAANTPNRIARSRWKHIDVSQPVSSEDELELVKAYQDGDRDAGGILVMAHQGLIKSMAKKILHFGVSMDDLVSEANMGMCKAIDKFNPEEGTRLSTYAVWWIRQYLRKALTENARIIRIPIGQQNAIREIHTTAARLTEITGAYPSDEEIAEELKMSTYKVQNLRNLTVPMISLSAPVGGDGGSDTRTYEDILSDQTGAAESPLESLTKKNSKESIHSLIAARLNAKEQMVVFHRFGMNQEPAKTLGEVGDLMGLTRERVRQIQENALKKLKKSITAEMNQLPTMLGLFSKGDHEPIPAYEG